MKRKSTSAEWEATLKAAKTEKEAAVGCEPTPESRNAQIQFHQALPNILKLNPIGARGYATHALAERRARKYLADAINGGSTSSSQVLAPANAIEPIRAAFLLPEVANQTLRKVFEDALAEAGKR